MPIRRFFPFVTGITFTLLLACGGTDEAGCKAFCESLDCPLDNAVCDSGNQCACLGCQNFYDQYYSEATNYQGGPACEAAD